MQLNLIPVSEPSVSYGGKILTEAISRFRNQLLAVIVVCPEQGFEYDGEEATPASVRRADIRAAICLFRELGTIGQITGFIHEEGMNINISGTGGRYGKEFMSCLSQYEIQPWFRRVEPVYEHMAKWSREYDNFRIDKLSLFERLQYWKQFLIDEVVPRLYTEILSIFGGSRTGTWQKSWGAYDVNQDYVDENQLDAALANTDFYGTFLSEISRLRLLNNLSVVDKNVTKTLQRQIYTSAITCLETYLSDAFLNTVLSSDEHVKAFVSSFKDFKAQKLGMDKLFYYVDKSREIAKKAMLEVIYHNIPKVSHMYEETLGVSIPDFSKIQKDIATRHDLVHRNGKTKDGREVVVNKVIVEKVIARVERFVKEIDRQLKERQ